MQMVSGEGAVSVDVIVGYECWVISDIGSNKGEVKGEQQKLMEIRLARINWKM